MVDVDFACKEYRHLARSHPVTNPINRGAFKAVDSVAARPVPLVALVTPKYAAPSSFRY